jgi:hypothetical protein
MKPVTLAEILSLVFIIPARNSGRVTPELDVTIGPEI